LLSTTILLLSVYLLTVLFAMKHKADAVGLLVWSKQVCHQIDKPSMRLHQHLQFFEPLLTTGSDALIFLLAI